jgi:hypothetical protein
MDAVVSPYRIQNGFVWKLEYTQKKQKKKTWWNAKGLSLEASHAYYSWSDEAAFHSKG